MRSGLRGVLLAAFCVGIIARLLPATFAQAAGQDPVDLCDDAATAAAETTGVPLAMLLAITRVETGRLQGGQLRPWPWAINLDGQGYWFDSQDQAIAFADQQLAAGVENFDVGCFQINLRWHGTAFSGLTEVFDPHTNAKYAAKFLAELQATEGGWAEAVAAYHSRTPAVATRYLEKVKSVLAELDLPNPDPIQPVETSIPVRQNRFPLLQGGVSGGGGSLVPIIDAAVPLIGGFQ